ncbi:hypothetical protein H696_01511 [Fonticula alba]|uniref:Oxidation resistance protein 1 n=1 Tax=Fonticula alba TaxID=691883 RepID=A0A058ZCG8_FONAL|nr:hypothetical protein H696_01511 [Fonticula alba]KCV72105.1 hypothetical protein H696_01511 [Fonticula alba]|eukprot:XP_009493683.1 hypothetical protein H696_01511 [Fonticula alba]
MGTPILLPPTPYSRLLPTDSVRRAVASALPPAIGLKNWRLVYSTSRDGTSYQTLRSRCQEYNVAQELGVSYKPELIGQRHSMASLNAIAHVGLGGFQSSTSSMPTSSSYPVLFVVRDDRGAVFGCFASGGVRLCPHYTGTGESFVFSAGTLAPANSKTTLHACTSTNTSPASIYDSSSPKCPQSSQVKIFPWTQENHFFASMNLSSISFGGGNSSASGAAIWIDASLSRGFSGPCDTFGNQDTLASRGSFDILDIEIWGFDCDFQ